MALVLALASIAAAPTQAQATATHGDLKIVWVGDTMFGLDGYSVPDNGRALFTHVRRWLTAGDITLGNLEGVLATTGASKCAGSTSGDCFAFRANPRNASALKWAGFDAMNLANNHAMDYGVAARQQTVDALEQQGIANFGAPGQITMLNTKGIRIALIGLAPYPWAQDSLDLAGATRLAAKAARQADIVIAAIHAGAEGSDQTDTPYGVEWAFGENRGDTRRIAQTLVDAGADLVLGSGPHVIRGIQRYHGRLIAYSLGNFAGWHNFAQSAVSNQTGILEVTVGVDGKVRAGAWHSATLATPGVPVPEPANISAQLARSLSLHDFDTTAWPITPSGRLLSADHK